MIVAFCSFQFGRNRGFPGGFSGGPLLRPALMPANERQALTQKLDHSDQACQWTARVCKPITVHESGGTPLNLENHPFRH